MRAQGTIVEWKDDRGFGFIEPEGGGSQVFCHIKAFEVRVRRPMAGDRVTYELSKGSDGRTSAARVRPVGLEDAAYQPNGRSKVGKDVGQARGTSSRRVWTPAIVVTLLLAAGSYLFTHQDQLLPHSSEGAAPTQAQEHPQAQSNPSDDALRQAFEQHQNNVQVQGAGVVDRVLSDDNEGSRHQRFILRLNSGQTILIAHNIDLAPRVESLGKGDRVEFNGEYEWNQQGGVIHWTHHDPQGQHVAGWLKHAGRTYQK